MGHLSQLLPGSLCGKVGTRATLGLDFTEVVQLAVRALLCVGLREPSWTLDGHFRHLSPQEMLLK